MTEDMGVAAWLAHGVEAATGVPGLGPIFRAVSDERARRISLALATAEELTGRDREDLIVWARSTPESMSVLVRILTCAGTSGYDGTLRVLGGLLAGAIEVPDRSSEQEIIAAALEGLTREQLLVLASLSAEKLVEGFELSTIVGGRVSGPLIRPILSTLIARGLVEEQVGGLPPLDTPDAYKSKVTISWRLTSFGLALCDAAARVESSATSGNLHPGAPTAD